MRKSIVLAADNAYLIPLETTIKSVLYHNTEVDFYILNSDIAPEWFKLLVPKLKHFDSSIKNIHLDSNSNKGLKSPLTIKSQSRYKALLSPTILGIKNL